MSTIIDSLHLIARLRALRQAKGMSTQALADATGIPRGVLANLETGRREGLHVHEAALICEALGADLRVVLSDEPMPVATKVWVI